GILTLVALKNIRHLDLAGIVSMVVLTPTVDQFFRRSAPSQALPRGLHLPLAMWIPPLLVGLVALGWRCTRAPSSVRFVTPDGTPGSSWLLALERVPDGANLFVPFEAD